MKQLPRILMAVAALSLLGLFAFPLWRITLQAPQYPDGVTMYIYVNKLGGDSPGTLQNINILNHYVGMKYIEEDAIPELQYFPYIIIGLVVLGLGVALAGRRRLMLGWLVSLAVLGAAGIYDFYLWEYDYGHNLSPNAPIVIPDASFQPPLIGTKIILNFVATSMPHTGAIFIGLAMLLSAAAWWLKGRKGYDGRSATENALESPKTDRAAPKSALVAVLVTATGLFVSCTPEPQPIEYGADACDFCKMTIVDRQHAAEVVTAKGRVYKFDAVECMVNYVQREGDEQMAFLLVNDYANPGQLIDARSSTFLISRAVPSPMGAFLSAFERTEAARAVVEAKGGTLYNWTELKAHFAAEGLSYYK